MRKGGVMHTETVTWYTNRSEYHGEIPFRCLVKIKAGFGSDAYIRDALYHNGRFMTPESTLIPEDRIECFTPMPTGKPKQ